MKAVMKAANTQPNLDKDITYPVLVSGKIDGIRGCIQDGQLVSRSLKSSLNRHVTEFLSRPEFEGLDGELTVEGDLWNDFNHNQSVFMTQTGKPKFIFHVFDDITNGSERAIQRKLDCGIRVMELQQKFQTASIRHCPQHVANNSYELRKLYNEYREKGYEGLIVMSLDGKYKHGRSTLKQQIMLKLKPCEDSEAKVVGFDELMHNDDAGNSHRKENMIPGNTLGALVVIWENGQMFKIGTGFDDAMRKEIWENQDKWLNQLVTFKYMEKTPYGLPRGPVFKGKRSKEDLS